MKIGDVVKWSSHSRENETEKVGKVLTAVKPGEVPEMHGLDRDFLYLADTDGHAVLKGKQRRYNAERLSKYPNPRDHKSYIIEVQDTETGKPKLYWPKVNWLKPTRRK